ncbi:MAG: ABC transporter substrate-binding protein [Thermoguttaceae bacterium]
MKPRLLPLLMALPLLAATGCPKPEEANQGPVGPPPGTSLRVLVVDDPLLAQSIGYLQNEWKAQSGFALDIIPTPLAQFDAQTAPAADVVVFPSWMFGTAAEAGWVAPLPQQVIQNNENDWANQFSLIRSHEIAWGGQPMAVPFGSPVPVLYFRPDLLEKAGSKTPATWPDYVKAAAALGDSSTAEPLAEGWAGLTLLARSAAYATHPDNLSVLFRIATMEPLISTPPFVRALDELVASAHPDSLQMDPAAVRAAFWQGKAAMAITWPTAADEAAAKIQPDFPAAVAELPGSTEVYDLGESAWEKRDKADDGRIPLLGAAGRLGVVVAAGPWTDPSRQLLFWLTGEKWSAQVASQSPNTTLFRRSHLAAVSAWVEAPMPQDAAPQYGEAISSALDRQQALLALAIPGRPEYLAALDAAVRAAVKKEKSPQEALDTAAAQWKAITQRLGVDHQKSAYRASLGLK